MSSATQARALVASLLRGDLDATVHTSQLHVLRFPGVILPLRRSPVTAVNAVVIDGATIDSTAYSFTPFALVREDGENWPVGQAHITYTTGWDEGYEPPEVQEAIALATTFFDGNPGAGVTSFREGAEAVTVDQQQAVRAIRSLLAKWVRL